MATRQEHLEWCKKRALEYIDINDLQQAFASMVSDLNKHPETKGLVLFDENKRITSFKEKPKKADITSHYANAGIYVCNKKLLSYLKQNHKTLFDFGVDVFPYLLENKENMYAYLMNEFLLDIGTIETYNLAQEKVKELNF